MNRIKLKCGGKASGKSSGKSRRKALFGADGALMAAATLAAAGITSAATAASAKSQAKAMVENAKAQAQSIQEQTANSNTLQQEQLAFTRSQNEENRQQQRDIQATLQLMAGQENMNDRMERNKMQLKLGGNSRRTTITSPFYGGAQFRVTDGGGVIPLAVNTNGYGLYEIIGNDHEHYHKTPGGKNKTGVGIKFNDGSVVEGEGNQNTNQGELLYVTPNDAMFISKHNIAGFNPTKAVKAGVHPEEAFAIQETLKYQEGLNDDGSKLNRKSIKRTLGGLSNYNEYANMTQNPINMTAPIAGGVIYGVTSPTSSPVEGLDYKGTIAKKGCRVSLKCGGRKKVALGTDLKWEDYAGATYSAAGNLLGAGLSTFGNIWAANRLGKAYNEAGNILADAYSKMHGIDLNEVNMEDYAAPHTLAVIRDPNTNINPQLERIRRNSVSERREINRGTLSSAARQQRLAATNDRMFQRMGEQYAYKNNADEQIKQGNAERITQTAQANADRDVQARAQYARDRMSLLQYNNNIENAKIAGMAQSRADAITQSSLARAQGLQSSMSAIGSGITASAQGFASTANGLRNERVNRENILIGADSRNKVDYLISNTTTLGNKEQAYNLWNSWKNSSDERLKQYASELAYVYNFK